MASSTYLTELKRFCQTTSVRGVPRIINSKSTLQSVIWLLGVLTCSGLLTWQMTVVFNRYLSYPVNTVLVQSPLGENAAFPDITICNLFSLVHENEMNLSYNEYIRVLIGNVYPKYYDYLPNSTTKYADLLKFWSKNAYFVNFPLLPHFGKDLQDSPVIDCRYYNWNSTENTDYGCNTNNFANVHQIWDPSYYKCYTYSLNNSARPQLRGFSSVIYVEDFREQIFALFTSDGQEQDYMSSKGIQILIHSPGSKPDMTLGIPIETGMSTKITIDQTKVSHLPYPYSNCTTQKTLGVLDQITPYSVKYCTDVCLQNHYLNECGCISSYMQFTAYQFTKSNYTMCGNLSINAENSSINWDGLKKQRCSKVIQEKYQMSCDYKCLIPCEEYTYDVRASAAQWPHKSGFLSFYSQYISGQSRYGTYLDEFHILLNDDNYTDSKLNNLVDKFDQEGLIANKFIQLFVQFNRPSFLEQKDVAAFSFDAFGAQIGGVLSLWLGVTIILVFEMCEVIINLLTTGFLNRRKLHVTPE